MNAKKYFFKILYLCFFIIMGIWTIPSLLIIPTSGLDPSWQIGLCLSKLKNLQFGKDIIFTFGPLGFLNTPLFVDFNLWTYSFFFTLFIHLSFLSSIAILLKKYSANFKEYILIAIVMIIAIPILPIEYKIIISAIVLLCMIIDDKLSKKYQFLMLSIIFIILGAISLLKFTAMILSLSIVLPLFIYYIYKKQLSYSALIAVGFGLSIIFCWFFLKQDFSYLPRYLYNSFEIASGYNSTMQIHGPVWELLLGIIVISSFMILLTLVKYDLKNLIFFLISSGFIFISFKHGFVRHDGHAYIFFANMLVFLTIIHIKLDKQKAYRIYHCLNFLVIIFLAFTILYQYPHILKPQFSYKTDMIKNTLSLLNNTEEQKKITEKAKKQIRRIFPLDKKTLKIICGRTVDIFPCEISLAYAYDIDWSPRPIFQSYSAYTDKLDYINAEHFQNKRSPEYVLYAFESIDGRYPVFDEPLTFQKLLSEYSLLYQDNQFLFLQKNKKITHMAPIEILANYEKNIGESISIPTCDNGYLFAKIRMEYSLFGKMMKFFFKPSEVSIRFIKANGVVIKKFRFIPDNSENGVFISQYINDIDDLLSIFSQKIDQDKIIKKIIINVDNNWHFKKNIKIDFFSKPAELRFITKNIDHTEVEKIDWIEVEKIDGGFMFIDSINDILYMDNNIQDFNLKQAAYIDLSGWAVDNKKRDCGEKIYIVWKHIDSGKEIILPTSRNSRPDVSAHFKEKNYNMSGWCLSLDSDIFKKGEYSISVRILCTNGKEYFELNGNKKIIF